MFENSEACIDMVVLQTRIFTEVTQSHQHEKVAHQCSPGSQSSKLFKHIRLVLQLNLSRNLCIGA